LRRQRRPLRGNELPYEVWKYAPDGSRILFASGLNNPTGIAVQIVPEPSIAEFLLTGSAVLVMAGWVNREYADVSVRGLTIAV